MTDTKPEALRLAEMIEDDMSCISDAEIAAELRRLHQINVNLIWALKTLIDMDVAYLRGDKVAQAVDAAKETIAKAEVTK
jgi:hypothetical protein